ncbi:hypothetical protein KR222_009534 [Zaprionus bogoriensis]|nr:hypothetical protein KR222_009534 [Zaprionus bogoriensis]
MLKWAVNQPRPSYLELQPGKTLPTPMASPPCLNPYAQPTPTPVQRSKQRRHSLLPPLEGKENHATLTSTPLPATATSTRAPLLRDLSNIMSPLSQTPAATPPPPLSRRSQLKLKPGVYASTLPTFEAEYSPSYRPSGSSSSNNLVPGPLLALRGVGIPDSYFEKPRYLEQKPLTALPATATATASAAASAAPLPPAESTLSSSQMGDVTLERMIDAILQSTRKPAAGSSAAAAAARRRRRSRSLQRRRVWPTYRPAFDPASDLCEYWQAAPLAAATAAASPHSDDYEEREVRSPGSALEQEQHQDEGKRRSLQLQLRRQRVVRRKRKIATKISSSVRQSAQKLLAAASRSAHKLPPPTRHISPDSGQNSTSDCELEEELELQLQGEGLGGEELEAACKLDAIWMQSQPRDATKRRLSFSLNDDS